MAPPAPIPIPTPAPTPPPSAPRQRWWASCACLLLGVVTFVVLGKSDTPLLGCASVLESWLRVGWMPAVYLLAAWGLVRAIHRRWFPHVMASHTLWLALGLALLLTLSHALAWLGGLDPRVAMGILAWLPIAAGLGCALMALRHARELSPPAALASRWSLPGCVAIGCLMAAACSPPGVLWSSEFGGYDALSYHLQLPQEWLLAGGMKPSLHNVYGFLPSALEAAFAHVGVLRSPAMRLGEGGGVGGGAWAAGLLDAQGAGLLAAQQLHALLALAACLACGRLASAAAASVSANPDIARRAASLAFSLAACTPWVLVVGSLAYNEMPMLLALAAIGVVLLQARRGAEVAHPLRLGLLVGLLAGMAVIVKPTAMLFVAVPAGVAMLLLLPRGVWVRAILGATVAGALMLAPWMARSVLATRNPVFPFAASLFPNPDGGTGHWNTEQVARFGAGHRFQGTWGERLRLTIAPDPHDPMGSTHRGLRHPQWGVVLFASFAVAGGLALTPRPHHRVRSDLPLARSVSVLPILLLGVQLLLWLFATHVQSRFLLPMLPIAAATCAAALASLTQRTLGRLITLLALGVQCGFLAHTIRHEPRGAATALLATPADLMGAPGTLLPNTPDDALSPEQWINTHVPPRERMLLLGDATPLLYRGEVSYATTWDTHPLALVIEAAPQNAARWTPLLREQGFSRVLINASELQRLERSGFLDPRLDPARIASWAREETTLIRAWPERGQYLVLLTPPARQ
jgi:hypothetical protein